MTLLVLTTALLAALRLAGPAVEQSVALVGDVVREADAAGVPRELAVAVCARASRIGLDDARACACGRDRGLDAQARCIVRRLAAGHRRCGLWTLAVQRARSGRCRGAVGWRRSVYAIRRAMAPVALGTWAP